MKQILIIILIVSCFSACEKKVFNNADQIPVNASSHTYVKFVNAYAFATPLFAGQTSASVQLTYNGVQFSGTPIALGSSFPTSSGYATVTREKIHSDMYVRLASGTPPAAVKDSFIFAFTPNLTRNKYYTFFFCDSINSPNTILTTEDDVRLPSDAKLYRARFVNLIPNPPAATPAIDLYSTREAKVVFSNIRYKQVTPFVELTGDTSLITGTVADTWQIRWSGTTTVAGSLAVTINNQMSVTLFARGLNLTTGARAPGLSSYRNQ
jgi:hypothetical protein